MSMAVLRYKFRGGDVHSSAKQRFSATLWSMMSYPLYHLNVLKDKLGSVCWSAHLITVHEHRCLLHKNMSVPPCLQASQTCFCCQSRPHHCFTRSFSLVWTTQHCQLRRQHHLPPVLYPNSSCWEDVTENELSFSGLDITQKPRFEGAVIVEIWLLELSLQPGILSSTAMTKIERNWLQIKSLNFPKANQIFHRFFLFLLIAY